MAHFSSRLYVRLSYIICKKNNADFNTTEYQWNSLSLPPPSSPFSSLKERGAQTQGLSDYTQIRGDYRHELAAGAQNTENHYFFIIIRR